MKAVGTNRVVDEIIIQLFENIIIEDGVVDSTDLKIIVSECIDCILNQYYIAED